MIFMGSSYNRNSSIKGLVPKSINWVLFILFSACMSFISLGLTYLTQLLSSIVIDGKYNLLKKAVIFLVCWTAFCLLIRFLYLYFKKKVIYEWNYNIKSTLMENILSRSPIDFKKKDRSYFASIFNNDIKFLEQNLLLAIEDIINQLFLFIFALVYSFYINHIMTLVILISGILTIVITNKLSSYAAKNNKAYMDSLGLYNETIDDGLRGYQVLYKSNALFGFMKLFRDKTESTEQNYSKSVFTTGLMNSLINQVSLSIQTLLFFIATILIIKGHIDVVYFPVFMSLMNLIIYPMYTIMSQYGQIRACKGIANNLKEELNFPVEDISSMKDDIKNSDILIKDLDFLYDDKGIFKNLDLHINSKEHILLRGNSGSGKSTFLKLLTRELTAGKGDIYIGDININEMSRLDLFNSISVISQNPMLFRDSILQNIVLFKDEKDIDYEKLNKAIENAGLNEFINSLEDGLYTVLLDSGDNLSGGEKQRIEVARAIYKDTSIVLIDEATSGLDLSKAVDLESIFNKMDKTIISTSHRKDIDLSKLYDRIYYIEGHNILEKTKKLLDGNL